MTHASQNQFSSRFLYPQFESFGLVAVTAASRWFDAEFEHTSKKSCRDPIELSNLAVEYIKGTNFLTPFHQQLGKSIRQYQPLSQCNLNHALTFIFTIQYRLQSTIEKLSPSQQYWIDEKLSINEIPRIRALTIIDPMIAVILGNALIYGKLPQESLVDQKLNQELQKFSTPLDHKNWQELFLILAANEFSDLRWRAAKIWNKGITATESPSKEYVESFVALILELGEENPEQSILLLASLEEDIQYISQHSNRIYKNIFIKVIKTLVYDEMWLTYTQEAFSNLNAKAQKGFVIEIYKLAAADNLLSIKYQ